MMVCTNMKELILYYSCFYIWICHNIRPTHGGGIINIIFLVILSVQG